MTKELFNEYKQKERIFPCSKEYVADEITPTTIFSNLKGNYKFLLESSNEGTGRYSFMGENPRKRIYAKGEHIFVEYFKNKESFIKKIEHKTLTQVLREHMIKYQNIQTEIPFTGGAVGYIGYDCIGQIHSISLENLEELHVPDAMLMFYDTVIVYDHVKRTVTLVRNIDLQYEQDRTLNYEEVINELEQLYEKIIPVAVTKQSGLEITTEPFVIEEGLKERFCKKVEKSKRYIQDGEILQVVLSNRFKKKTKKQGFDIYRNLRIKNPSPYLFYIDCCDFQVIGSSPESLVKVKDNIVTTLPIAGTRPRGKTKEEDEALEIELLRDKKELSEHMMLVQLGKDDISKVAKEETIEVSRLKEIERYSHVMHIVSEVRGELDEKKDVYDAFFACFPAGTVSGAEKVRAIEIIEELEDVKRELYSGAVGYFGYSGDMDMCIAIRTIVLKDEIAYVQAGAGIVIDSIPEKEYEETVNKGKALMEVV